MKFFYTFFLLSCCTVVFAQQKSFTLIWDNQKQISFDKSQLIVPGFQDEYFFYSVDKQQVLFTTQWQATQNEGGVKLTQVAYQDIGDNFLENININELPSQPVLTLETHNARHKKYTSLSVTPLVRQNGQVKKITSFSVSYTIGGTNARFANQFNQQQGIVNSVLASGDWYRFYVKETGVHKISRNFLRNLGVDVSAINPQTIKVYGHGGEMLPLVNAAPQDYDIPEIAIQIVGGEDGSFDENDYVLFYASAVNQHWNEESKTFQNLYADKSYYYITTTGGAGKRVQPYVEPTANATMVIDRFDDVQFYETDLYNIAKTGRRWLGDRFDVENERTYEFSFPNLITTTPIRYGVGAGNASASTTSMRVALNGEEVGGLNFSAITDAIYGRYAYLAGNHSVSSGDISAKLTYHNNGNPSSLAYLDYIFIEAQRALKVEDKSLKFQYKQAATLPGVGQYQLQNTQQVTQIWDVTNPQQITSIQNTNAASTMQFKANMGELRTYIALLNDYYRPYKDANAKVENINLKGNIFTDAQGNFADVDYLMVTSKELLPQAMRLANYRSTTDNLNIKVVLDQDIYTEFNSGKQDIAAIRNFVKYIYDNASSNEKRIKYLCLFGDASVDYKDRLQRNNNIIPTYQRLGGLSFSVSSSTTASDDFFGMLDANEGSMNSAEKLDIAVGRILADNPQLAKTLVDKIIAYEGRDSYGAWRNNFVLISDDPDKESDKNLQFVLDGVGDEISEKKPFINVKKIHADAYVQESSSGGDRYPQVNEAIDEAIEVGACVVNYLGHGGETGLGHERFVTLEGIKQWQNENKYNVFVTVTCEFTRFDNPYVVSPGEENLFNTKGGSAAMVSTIRTISINTGQTFNQVFAPFLFDYEDNYISVAESVRLGKNSVSSADRRTIFYFGDPAMKLSLAKPKINLTAINDVPIAQSQDTLKALSKVKLSGEVVTENGSLLQNYNGELSTVIFDKRIKRKTLGNDGTASNGELVIMEFTTLGEIIFRGKASVKQGKFDIEFVVPKDISIPVGDGRVSFYAIQDGVLLDNRGYNNAILVGGLNENAPEDNKGPEIELYMNDENFVNGGITNHSPYILAKLSDENGINTASGIGHDLVAILDDDETNPYVLNDYYETEMDDYTKGTAYYKLRDLEEGLHTLKFRAWDVYNNSSTAEIQFVVAGKDELKITNVLNYPNPFHNYTEFWFNHNRPFEPLEVQVQVFTVTGKVVWTANRLITTSGFLSRDISWDGKDDFGDAIGKGVYVYKLTVKSTLTNKKVEKYEKLVIL